MVLERYSAVMHEIPTPVRIFPGVGNVNGSPAGSKRHRPEPEIQNGHHKPDVVISLYAHYKADCLR